MIIDKFFTQNAVLESAMHASVIRNDVIQNNISNVDTPGFKKKEVVFEQKLSQALNKAEQLSNLDLTNVKPEIRTANLGFNYRIDENNVDIELEMVELHQNSIRYDTMVGGILNNYKRIAAVLSSR